PEDGPKRGGTVRTAWGATTSNFDMHQGGNSNVLTQMYSNLVRRNPADGVKEIVPELAIDWEITEGVTQYDFNLREGVKFTDGSDFTADDVVANFERIVNPPEGNVSPFRSNFNAISGVEAVDDLTVRFNLSEPRVWMFDWFAFPALGLYSKATLDANNQDLRKLAFAPGTGPFTVNEHLPGEKWILDANPDHWNPNVPYVDRLEMIHVPNSVDRGTAVLTDQADWSWNVAPETWDEGTTRPDIVTTALAPSFGGQILYINNELAPFDDARVRTAIRLVINRHDAVLVGREGGFWYDLGRWIHPKGEAALSESELADIPGYRKDHTADIETAKALLAEAGFPDGEGFPDVEIATPTVPVFSQAFSPFVQDMLGRHLNIDVSIRTYERALEGEELKKDYQLIVGTLGGRPPTPDHTALWLANWGTGGSLNFYRYSNPEFDEITAKLNRTLDADERAALFRRGEEILDEDSPAVPLGWISHQLMWRNYVKGLTLDRRAVVEWGRIETVWLDR
ncbi:MAG: ABC transporter substrate-binding protein, partial [Chloroflexi bacterium]|nr:ABC transporter substrate-binding protein [Chloroflexota bacterium]